MTIKLALPSSCQIWLLRRSKRSRSLRQETVVKWGPLSSVPLKTNRMLNCLSSACLRTLFSKATLSTLMLRTWLRTIAFRISQSLLGFSISWIMTRWSRNLKWEMRHYQSQRWITTRLTCFRRITIALSLISLKLNLLSLTVQPITSMFAIKRW